MARFGFVGPSYQSQSINADDQACQNWYPEVLETGEGKSRIVLYPTPGLTVFSTLPVSTIRGIFNWGIGPPLGRCFAIGDAKFFEIFSDGTFFQYTGVTIPTDGNPVSFAASGTELMFTSAGSLFHFQGISSSFTLTQIAPATFVGQVAQVTYVDGFFVVWILDTNQIYASAPNDGTTWPGLSTARVSVFPDNLISMISDHRELWLFGEKQIAVYYNAGLFPFPFDVVSGGFIENSTIGATISWSPARIDNSVFWLGGDERGDAIAWRANGYTPVRISNHAVETAWRSYAVITDAIGYTYQDNGHSFYIIRFPNANHTWVYDVATGMWHERNYFNTNNLTFTAHRSTNHAFVFAKHLVGDWATGTIYQLDPNNYTDNGNPIVRLRRAPHISTEMEWIFHHQLMVDMETNQGILTLPPASTLFKLLDSNGSIWNLTINALGILQLAPGTTPPPAQQLLLNDPADTTTWQIIATTFGAIRVVPLPFTPSSPPNPKMLQMNISPTPTSGFQVTVTNFGMLQVAPVGAFSTVRQPQLNLRWSNDGGHTWSNYYTRNTGDSIMQFATRVIWRRLGRARVRTYEVSTQDPTFFRLIDAYLLASPSFTPTERLVKQYGKSA